MAYTIFGSVGWASRSDGVIPPGRAHAVQVGLVALALSHRLSDPLLTTYRISVFAGDCSKTLQVPDSPVDIFVHETDEGTGFFTLVLLHTFTYPLNMVDGIVS